MPAERAFAAGILARRRGWLVAGGVLVLAGLALAAFMLKPVDGPPRDLTLNGDAGRGAYVIRLGGCEACHTDHAAGGAALAGGGPMNTPFGTFYPPNITPDPETGIGGWTLAQFSDALSNGVGPEGNLYPVFPYPNLTLMSDQDVVDLYAAIMAMPPVHQPSREHQVVFPLNYRVLVSGWKNLFFSPRRYYEEPSRSAAWNRGAYLADGLTHCVSCHSPMNALGATEPGLHYTGNSGGDPGGKAPPLTKLALLQDGYTVASLADTLRTGITPNAGKVGDEMGLVISDETSHWTDADRRAVAIYLLDLD